MSGPDLNPELSKISPVNSNKQTQVDNLKANLPKDSPVKPDMLTKVISNFPLFRKGTPKDVTNRARDILFKEATGQGGSDDTTGSSLDKLA